jgi:hypothetical protein
MPETRQPQWEKIAQARGIPAAESMVKSLEGLERDFSLIRAGLDWLDEPATTYRAAEEEAER